jgi:hypothetical protein
MLFTYCNAYFTQFYDWNALAKHVIVVITRILLDTRWCRRMQGTPTIHSLLSWLHVGSNDVFGSNESQSQI